MFFECRFSSACWSVLGIAWDLSLELSDRLAEAERNWGSPLFLEVAILGAWNVWKQRNRKHFEGVDTDMQTWIVQMKSDLDTLSCRVKPEMKAMLMSFADGLHA